MRVQGQGPGLTYYPRKAAIFPLHEWLGDFEEESNPSINDASTITLAHAAAERGPSKIALH